MKMNSKKSSAGIDSNISESKKVTKKSESKAPPIISKNVVNPKPTKNNLVNSSNRIVIGDVGSGKTMVAYFAALGYFNGLKGKVFFEKNEICLVAPTEVLTVQHYSNFFKFFDRTEFIKSIDVVLFTSKTKKFNNEIVTQKELDKKLLGSTNKNIFWIGTHSLFFANSLKPLLILIDEQHRFGVRQRQQLTELNNKISAHFVSFSATPIPRTLVSTLYGNLKPLLLEKINGRNPVKTIIKSIDHLEDFVVSLINDRILKKQKTFVICSKVENNPDDDLFSIDEIEERMRKHFDDKVLTIHGKIKNKNEILNNFKVSNDKFVLISTTVVEVGVDVEDATLIIVVNAERFGLATLHQLRGRIGRNDIEDNLCVLLPSQNYEYSKRLRYMSEYSSGFDLAQKDLELRGGGDLFGVEQSGFEEEYDIIYTLPSELIEEVNQIVGSLEFKNLDSTLPRLHNYLEKEAKDVWKE